MCGRLKVNLDEMCGWILSVIVGGVMIQYPKTPKVNVVDTMVGVEIVDPYRWLENLDDSRVREWIRQQNALTRGILDSLPGRRELIDELMKIFEAEVVSLPAIHGGRFFYTKRKGKENHPILYVVEDGFVPDSGRVVIDPNKFSEDGTVAMDWYYPSVDGRYVAYGKSKGGSENSTLYIMDVDRGEPVADTIPDARWASIAWMKEGNRFYYTRNTGGEKFRPMIFMHKMGEPWEDDRLVFGETLSEKEIPGIRLSSDGNWVIITVHRGWTQNDLYVMKLSSEKLIPIAIGIEAIFSADVIGDTIFIKTNYKAPRYRILRTTIDKPDIGEWQEIIPEGKGVIEQFGVVGGKLVITVKQDTYYRLLVYTTGGELVHEVQLPTYGSVRFSGRWDSDELYYRFVSFFYPPTIYRLNLKTFEGELVFQQEVEFDHSEYEQHLIFYESKDGTKVPMYVIHKKGIVLDGNNPTILTGYGGFGLGMSPYFVKTLLPWLARGGVYAHAGIRGGDEYGEEWHRAGMLDKKQNVFDDFIAAAEYLIDVGYTKPDRLAIMGGSNGGLLVGAAMTQRPELFRVVVCSVPLLDMLRYHKFLVAHLWIPEYGDPEDPNAFKWLYAYSPYHHVEKGRIYPAVLFKTAESDTRVHPMHAMKMAAKLQALATPDRPVLLYIEPKSGHGAGKPLRKVVESYADNLLFIMWQLGMLGN